MFSQAPAPGPLSTTSTSASASASASLGVAFIRGNEAERLLLEAAALRRRQLCAAFLHGSTRSWRVRRRIWPAAATGLLIVAIAIAALAVAGAFARQQEFDREILEQPPTATSVVPVAPWLHPAV